MEKGRVREGTGGRVTVLVITEDWGSDALRRSGESEGVDEE